MAAPVTNLAVFRRDKFVCAYCDYDGKVSFDAWYHGALAIDHKTPKAIGADTPDNLCVTCTACNGIKQDKIFNSLEDARLWLGLYRELVSHVWYDRFVVSDYPLHKLDAELLEVNKRFSEKTGYLP